jgi:hypothetical protein
VIPPHYFPKRWLYFKGKLAKELPCFHAWRSFLIFYKLVQPQGDPAFFPQPLKRLKFSVKCFSESAIKTPKSRAAAIAALLPGANCSGALSAN